MLYDLSFTFVHPICLNNGHEGCELYPALQRKGMTADKDVLVKLLLKPCKFGFRYCKPRINQVGDMKKIPLRDFMK